MLRKVGVTIVLAMAGGAVYACSGDSSSNNNQTSDAGDDTSNTTDAGIDGGGDSGGGPTTTIAKARQGKVTTPITVQAVVTAVRGDDPADTKEWYIEDPAGGPYSGIAVYCDKTKTCPAAVNVPARLDLVLVTGSITSYKGKLELAPTAESTISSGAALPPLASEDPADLGASGTSQWQGVLIQVKATKLTVDNLTPQSLDVAKCDPPATPDAGSGEAGSPEGGASDGGAPSDGGQVTDGGSSEGGAVISTCGCKPPRWAGFQVNDGAGNEMLIENHFYTGEHLQNSPECLTQAGAIPVTSGQTFSKMTGIFDLNPGNAVQTLSPTLDSDYTTP